MADVPPYDFDVMLVSRGFTSQQAGGTQQVVGRPAAQTLVVGTGVVTASLYVYADPVSASGFLEKLDIYNPTIAGNVVIKRYTKSGDDFTQVGSDLIVPVSPGSNSLTYKTFGQWPVNAGDRLGIYARAGSSGLLSFLNGAGDSNGYYGTGAGNVSTFTDATTTVNIQLQLRFTVNTALPINGLAGDVSDLQNAVTTLSNDNYDNIVPTGYLLVWAIGQSNTSGRAVSLSPETFTTAQAYKYVRASTNLQPMADPVGNDTGAAGSLWPSFAKMVQRLSKGKIGVIVVNSAKGGTSILTDWAVAGSAYTGAVTDLGNALTDAATKKLPIVGCCTYMQQGETDGDNVVTSAAYKTGFQDLKTRVDGVIGAKVPFLMTRIGTISSGDTAGYATIRQAQDELTEAEANVFMPHTGARYFAERGLMMDSFHYLIAGYQEIGATSASSAYTIALGQRPKGYHG